MSELAAGRVDEFDCEKDDVIPIGWGLMFNVICTPNHWTHEQAAARFTALHPPGTTRNKWVPSESMERSDGFNGVVQRPCPCCPNRIHWLVNC